MTKKILLTLGSVTAVVAPVATVVACGSEDEKAVKKFSNSFPTEMTSSKSHTDLKTAIQKNKDGAPVYKKGFTVPGSVLGIVDAKAFNTKDIKVTYKVIGTDLVGAENSEKTLKIQVEFKKGDLVETKDIEVKANKNAPNNTSANVSAANAALKVFAAEINSTKTAAEFFTSLSAADKKVNAILSVDQLGITLPKMVSDSFNAEFVVKTQITTAPATEMDISLCVYDYKTGSKSTDATTIKVNFAKAN